MPGSTALRQKERRKAMRKELREIEKMLHPCPVFDGIEVLHEHRGRRIVFTAWREDTQIRGKEVAFPRKSVLYGPADFYEANKRDFQWLVAGSSG